MPREALAGQYKISLSALAWAAWNLRHSRPKQAGSHQKQEWPLWLLVRTPPRSYFPRFLEIWVPSATQIPDLAHPTQSR